MKRKKEGSNNKTWSLSLLKYTPNYKLLIFVFILIVSTIFIIIKITTNINYDDFIYTINFESSGGTPVITQKLKSRDIVIEPNNPVKEGFTFVGWYDGDQKYNFDKFVNDNLTLIAVWEKKSDTKSYNVYFDSNGGSNIITIEVAENNQIYSPIPPTKKNFKFDGWYLNGREFNFKNPITKNITLIAAWLPIAKSKDNKSTTEIHDNNGENHGVTSNVLPPNTETTTTSKNPTIIKSSSISFNKHSITLNLGESTTLVGTISPTKATNNYLNWRSLNEEIASISFRCYDFCSITGEGLGKGYRSPATLDIHAKKLGTTKIIATSDDGNSFAEIIVNVVNILSEAITLTPSNITIIGASSGSFLHATVSPTNVSKNKLYWTSSNPSVVKVPYSTNELYTSLNAVAPGTSTITVTTGDGLHSASATVTVTDARAAYISIGGCPRGEIFGPNMSVGETTQLYEIPDPHYGFYGSVTWSSTNQSVAAVSTTGLVTAISPGRAFIRIITSYNTPYYSCQIDIQ